MEAVNAARSWIHRLGDLSADATASLVEAGADMTLVLDGEGVVQDMSFADPNFSEEGCEEWLGRPWGDTVTIESVGKVEELLQAAADGEIAHRRQINHPSPQGRDLPVLYSVVRLSEKGPFVALGRDLRTISDLQQRLVSAQQSLERDYERMRQAETRYRLLFHVATEAVVIVDGGSQKIIEANPAASEAVGVPVDRLVGRRFPEGFDRKGTKAVQEMMESARATGRADTIRARSEDGEREFGVSASLFRQDGSVYFLIRIADQSADSGSAVISQSRSQLLEIVDKSPEGFVVTSPDARIIMANDAFLELAQLVKEDQVRGEPLDRWLGRGGVDLKVLVANLRQNDSARFFATTLRGEYGLNTDVEVSAVSVPDGDPPCLGFMIRNVDGRLVPNTGGDTGLPHSPDQFTDLVGRMSLKEIVRDTTDVIERLCIEAALELTRNNRASAAEMLGLSRQSLYVKLRRYGLGDLESDADS